MGHESKRDRRKRLRAARDARNQAKASRRGTRGGVDSGAFSETGFVEERKRTVAEVQRDNRVQAKIPGTLANLSQQGALSLAVGAIGRGGRLRGAGGFAGSTFQIGTAKGAGAAARARGFIPSARRIGQVALSAAAGAALSQGFEEVFQGGLPLHRGTGQSISTLPGVGGQLPPGNVVVKTWNTGTAQFARLLDGRIAVQRKDGTIKTYRPQKHIVIPRNPRVGTLIRADKRLKRLTKGLKKVVK